MTLNEMHIDLLKRYYEAVRETIENAGKVDLERKQEILHEACNVFSFACEKISCQDD